MDTQPRKTDAPFQSLADYVVKYDMGKLATEARSDFETIVSSRELVSQDYISQMFNEDN